MGFAIHVFCKCGTHLGRASFGDRWFVEQSFPVCPECGASKYSFIERVVRWHSEGWFKPAYWQERVESGEIKKLELPTPELAAQSSKGKECAE